MECLDCHETLPTSAAAEDLNFPSMESCGRCHDVDSAQGCATCHANPEAVVRRANRSANLRFSHQGHLALGSQLVTALSAASPPVEAGGTVCESCHRGIRQTMVTGPGQYPKMSDCLTCHQSERDAMRACGTCHPDTRDLLPLDHRVPTFFDDHAQVVAQTSSPNCRMCHTPGYNPCSQCH